MLPHDRSLTIRGQPDLVQEIQDHHARRDLDDGDELLELVPGGASLVSQVVAGLYRPAGPSFNIRNEHRHRLLVRPIDKSLEPVAESHVVADRGLEPLPLILRSDLKHRLAHLFELSIRHRELFDSERPMEGFGSADRHEKTALDVLRWRVPQRQDQVRRGPEAITHRTPSRYDLIDGDVTACAALYVVLVVISMT